ncbi:NUDIX domain-containing protein [Cytobacillus spongiae]|uniref:NUDIX domain-containing protein n=1 Tax=Cytobacillus spongiae TaxID=2901381 RepID=UPI002279BDEF|nr:NUDIX domain-containing protein [Cytobacillus spongiae]
MPIPEEEIWDHNPIAGSFSVIMVGEKVLMCYNVFRQQWELPAGKREGNETTRECALRELFEETGQHLQYLHFKGLMKVKKASGAVQYNPVYTASLKELQPFIPNPETNEIILWDQKMDIGTMDAVDVKLLLYL